MEEFFQKGCDCHETGHRYGEESREGQDIRVDPGNQNETGMYDTGGQKGGQTREDIHS